MSNPPPLCEGEREGVVAAPQTLSYLGPLMSLGCETFSISLPFPLVGESAARNAIFKKLDSKY